MQSLASDLAPFLVTALLTAIGTYLGYIHKLKERVAVLEHKTESLQKRLDSHSTKIDDILEGVNEIKITIAEIKATLNIVEHNS